MDLRYFLQKVVTRATFAALVFAFLVFFTAFGLAIAWGQAFQQGLFLFLFGIFLLLFSHGFVQWGQK